MADPISALEHRPSGFIREVSPEAIRFYVSDLSRIYLPEEFRTKHSDIYDVERWEPENRLGGKFGRFTVRHAQEEEGQPELDDILLMGTTIGLYGLDRRNLMSLRHATLSNGIVDILEARGLAETPVRVKDVDYGATSIILGENGTAQALRVSSKSYDYGRAETEGRQQTCELFERLLAGTVEVINADPEPRPHDRIITK